MTRSVVGSKSNNFFLFALFSVNDVDDYEQYDHGDYEPDSEHFQP
tara:strand:- start:199 stop:333 length:135 start_codon:yes stop_codon:yes gene_type:complete